VAADIASVLNKTRKTPIDGHRLSEFVYGTVSAMVAVAGISGADDMTWWSSALTIVLGAVAIWLAHAYAILLSKRVVSGVNLTQKDIRGTLKSSWPIVTAGMLLTIPILPVGFGVWSLEVGHLAANITGIVILGLVGYVAGILTGDTWRRRVALAILTAGIGAVIVALEAILHH
jgi:hypothetical protein